MIWALCVAAALVLLLYVIPVGIVTICLFSRKDPKPFDERPERLEKSGYAPWKEEILADIRWMRRQSSREVSIQGDDGVTLCGGWYDGGGEKTAILAHGFGASPLNNFSAIARAFLEKGWNVLLITQRAHGKSGGRATTLGVREGDDLRAWARWAENSTATRRSVLYGMSMGGASVACAAGKDLPASVKALVIDCGFYLPYSQMLESRADGRALLWRVMLPLIRLYVKAALRLDIRRDARDSLRAAPCPVYFLHGTADATVPCRVAQEAYDGFPGEKALSLVPGAPHTLAFLAGGETEKQKLFAFLNTCCEHTTRRTEP